MFTWYMLGVMVTAATFVTVQPFTGSRVGYIVAMVFMSFSWPIAFGMFMWGFVIGLFTGKAK